MRIFFRKLLPALSIAITDPLAYGAVFSLAQRYRLTVYDAACLDLAMREGLPIASRDGDLVKAAGLEGLALYQP